MESLSLKKESVGRQRLSWHYAPSFLLLWLSLFFAIVIPLYNRLPDKINASEESVKPGEFVAERAMSQLYVYDRIGPKVTGSYANEVKTVAFLLNEVEKIKEQMLSDLYEIEVDVQTPSGGFSFGSMVSMYQGIQNIVVKLNAKQSQSENYLLINSHFDSKPGSPSSGDDGTMVVVMLEVLRQMVISKTPFEHPIIFLFNGAEELGLQGSHGFITQHKWAANCKMVINLEVAGSGGRDILFQTGPNKPWLVKYYQHYAKHPFATTIAEEIFQGGLLPSDTDFRIFRDFGNVPGLDMAQINNGYVYHTVFDAFKVIPGRSVQNTGNNVLALVRAFSNASELYETENDDDGHTVFFDFLGLFFVYYTETTGIIMNYCFAVISLVLVGCSLWRMARQSEKVSLPQISLWFLIILGLHVVGVLLCFGLPLLMAVLFDAGDRSMTYFTSNWLVFGYYICPSVIGLVLPLTLYYTLKPNNKLSHGYHLQMSLHSHLVVQALLAIIFTAMGMRFQYLCLISMIFYGGALLINLVSTLQDRGNYWAVIVICLQVLPFCYFCYVIYMLLVVLIPITGRYGMGTNPDLMIALICGICTFFALGFIAQFINIFRWPKLILLGLGVVTFIFCMIAVSEVGFPYRPQTNVMRVNLVHTQRLFYEFDGSLSHSDSGYYFTYMDRRGLNPLKDSQLNLTGLVPIEPDCDKYVMCGAPCLYSCGSRKSARWLPRDSDVVTPGNIILRLLERTTNQPQNTVRYEFEVSGPPHMNIFVQPVGDSKVTDWSFVGNAPEKAQPPYYVFFNYGIDDTPLKFSIELTKSDGDFSKPLLELAVVGHFISHDYDRDAEALKFLGDFPDYVFVVEWPSILKRYIL
nr:endoplasmic reticulum metallopeptidase 1-like [Drosophila kikkawai]